MGKNLTFILLLCSLPIYLFGQNTTCSTAFTLSETETCYSVQQSTSNLISSDDIWQFHDLGQDLGSNWKNTLYNDDNWQTGPGFFGYNSSETTTVDYGDSNSDKHPTTYFRNQFSVFNTQDLVNPTIGLLCDDGAIVYLNGEEIIRYNMPMGDINYNTYALSSIGGDLESTYIEFDIDTELFNNGSNTIAVEVHQYEAGSSDLTFGLYLQALVLSNGPAPSCITDSKTPYWFQFTADNTAANIECTSNFNTILTLFSGNCNGLTEMACVNDDLYGFDGETIHTNSLIIGQTYYVRLLTAETEYGKTSGDFCIKLDDYQPLETPINDLCTNAIPLVINDTCVKGNNMAAQFEGPIPSRNERSTNDVWYTFEAPSDGRICLFTNADFSDVITVFESDANGGCSTLTEIYCNDFGQMALLENLSPNQTYFVQVSSFFSSTDGCVCVRASNESITPPTNDLCVNATHLNMGAECTSGSNEYAGFEDDKHSCDLDPQASVWYSFVAPLSGNVRVNTGAQFLHIVSLYEGTCGALTERACIDNPFYCNTYASFENLTPGTTYHLQISSATTPFGHLEGELCVKIEDNPFEPLKAKLKLALEGYYDTTTQKMRTVLANNYIMPIDHPYSSAPWNYTKNECVAAAPNNAVDWLYIELRSSTDIGVTIDKRVAFLRSDGVVIDTDGSEGVTFYNTPSYQDYYIVVYHRSHLGVISSSTVNLPNTSSYDFTTSLSKARGAVQLTEVKSGVFALIAGDFDQNGVINNLDFNLWEANSALVDVYLSADADGNGVITAPDFDLWSKSRSKVGVGELYP